MSKKNIKKQPPLNVRLQKMWKKADFPTKAIYVLILIISVRILAAAVSFISSYADQWLPPVIIILTVGALFFIWDLKKQIDAEKWQELQLQHFQVYAAELLFDFLINTGKPVIPVQIPRRPDDVFVQLESNSPSIPIFRVRLTLAEVAAYSQQHLDLFREQLQGNVSSYLQRRGLTLPVWGNKFSPIVVDSVNISSTFLFINIVFPCSQAVAEYLAGKAYRESLPTLPSEEVTDDDESLL